MVASRSVRFYYEPRNDIETSWTAGGQFKLSVRLTNIKTFYKDMLARDYRFHYWTGYATQRSRLRYVQECAKKSDGSDACLTPTYFDWKTRAANNAGFVNNGAYQLPVATHRYLLTAGDRKSHAEIPFGQFVDVNGDGLVDWVKAFKSTNGNDNRATYINTGSGWQVQNKWKLPDFIYDYSKLLGSDGFQHLGNRAITRGQFIDINGDGLVDWVRAYNDTTGDYRYTWLNTGSGWQAAGTKYKLPWVLNSYNRNWQKSGIEEGRLIDLNSDSLPDYIQAHKGECGTIRRSAWLNAGNGWWTRKDSYKLPSDVYIVDSSTVGDSNCWASTTGIREHRGAFIDLNGDGLPDWAEFYRNIYGQNKLRAWINTGASWRADNKYAMKAPIRIYDKDSGKPRREMQTGDLIDVNGDGLNDFVQSYRSRGGTTYRNTWLNTGHGWTGGRRRRSLQRQMDRLRLHRVHQFQHPSQCHPQRHVHRCQWRWPGGPGE